MNDRQPNRVSKGIPTGGQFAASSRGEAPVDLTTTTAYDDLDIRPGEDGETEVRRFGCENHDAPGECTPECTDLLYNMSADPTPDIYGGDPTGVHRGPDRLYTTYEYDAETRASIIVEHVPEHEVLITTVKPGQWITVDGEPRRVDSMTPGQFPADKVLVEFSGYDLDENGQPEAYFTRKFSADTTFDEVYPEDIPAHLRHLT